MYAETKNLIEKAMTNQEQIDKYLAGQMTEDEKLQFERLLSADDSSLRDEMELQKEIILAIRRRSLKEMLQGEEESIQKEKEDHHKRVVRWTLRSVASIAVAAVCLLLITLLPIANLMYDSSNVYYTQALEAGELRGCPSDTLSVLWSESVTALQKDDWARADEFALQVMNLSTQPIVGITDEERLDFYQQAEWMHANYLMHNKHIFKAKRLLQKISSDGGRFSKQSNDLLKRQQR